MSGRETYQTSSYVLRINRTFSSLYENTVSTTDVGKLYTYAQIQSEASSIASPISNAVNANTPSSGYWLKQAPVLSELSNRKLQLNQEWWWSDTWSTVLYDLKT
jgi:DNA gyrase inhibitor GyrI